MYTRGVGISRSFWEFLGISRTKTEFQEFLKKTEFQEFVGISGIFGNF
jgi:hypothetical protein